MFSKKAKAFHHRADELNNTGGIGRLQTLKSKDIGQEVTLTAFRYIDKQATILGGRNIGNEYFEADPDLAFGDLDVMAIGPVAQKVSASFDEYWNSTSAYPASVFRGKPVPSGAIDGLREALERFVRQQEDSAYLQALVNSSLARKLRADEMVFQWGEADVIYDMPEKIQHSFDKTEYHLSPKLVPYLKSILEELVIFSPYFVPGKVGKAFLSDLARGRFVCAS